MPCCAWRSIAATVARRRVAGHRARVAEAEVDVLVSVDVDEARALRLGDEEREAAGPLRHPVHRDAREERAA